MTYGIENQVLAQNRHTNVEGVKTVTVIPSFDNMISNSNTDINTINDFDFWCFNATFSSISAISWWPVLVVEEAGENHRPWASNW